MNYSLTAVKVKSAKHSGGNGPEKLNDGGGLYLALLPSGVKSWRYKYRLNDKEQLYTIGPYPEISLEDARKRHQAARGLVKAGIHPKAQRDAEKLVVQLSAANTFEAVANDWIAQSLKSQTPYYVQQVRKAFARDVLPAIGALPIREVKPVHLLTILKAVESRGAPVMAINIRQWCSAVFKHAIRNLQADQDPAEVLSGVIKRPPIKHNVALSPTQLTELMKQLQHSKGFRTTAIAIELLMHTFVRTGELRQARWAEFDFEKAEWRIPAGRMKMRVEHIVPLSVQSIALLSELRSITGGSLFLFPNNRRPDDCMTPTTINQALKRFGFSGPGTIEFSAHGFRGTAATLLREHGFRSEIVERQLAHAEKNKVAAAYNKAIYLAERREMMQFWSSLLVELGNS